MYQPVARLCADFEKQNYGVRRRNYSCIRGRNGNTANKERKTNISGIFAQACGTRTSEVLPFCGEARSAASFHRGTAFTRTGVATHVVSEHGQAEDGGWNNMYGEKSPGKGVSRNSRDGCGGEWITTRASTRFHDMK